jgi:phage repressor protein C with HTH and peptisase S24 domain
MLFDPVKSKACGGIDSIANNGRMARPKTTPKEIVASEAKILKAAYDEQKKTRDFSQDQFGFEYELGSQGNVWQYLNGHRPLNLSAALKFSRALNLPVAAFSPRLAAELARGGAAVMQPGELHASEPAPVRSMPIPVVGTARGGSDGYYVEIEYPPGFGDGFVSYPAKRSNAYALRVQGDSMRPRIKPGEFVIVEPDLPCNPGDEVIVKTKSGKAMVKVLHSRRGGFIELLSLNDDHKPMTVNVEDIEFVHHVTGIAKEPLYDKSK